MLTFWFECNLLFVVLFLLAEVVWQRSAAAKQVMRDPGYREVVAAPALTQQVNDNNRKKQH